MLKIKNTIKSWGWIGKIISFVVLYYFFWSVLPILFTFFPNFTEEIGVFVVFLNAVLSLLLSILTTYWWLKD